jgi:hypothetical protein
MNEPDSVCTPCAMNRRGRCRETVTHTNRLSAGEMAIQGADADAGAACDFFQTDIQPNFRERCLGGVN